MSTCKLNLNPVEAEFIPIGSEREGQVESKFPSLHLISPLNSDFPSLKTFKVSANTVLCNT